jgi:DNA-binding MurR/RpiR family transcriptional regulator
VTDHGVYSQNGANRVNDLRQRLMDVAQSGTPAEQAIAAYFLANLQTLPFETAATLALKTGVSEASIGRFCRKLGFQHLKALKISLQVEIGDQPWLIGDRLQEFHRRSQNGDQALSQSLEREVAALVAVYELAATPAFRAVVQRLATRKTVWVAGFQTERGRAAELAHNLQYLRPDVHLADVAAGHFAEVLLADPADTTLVLIDGRRYSRLTRDLALAARQAGIAVTLITDPYCAWAQSAADEVFAVPTDLNHFWDSTSAMSSLIGLLVNGVFRVLGPRAERRLAKVSDLHGTFIGHLGTARGAGRLKL